MSEYMTIWGHAKHAFVFQQKCIQTTTLYFSFDLLAVLIIGIYTLR